MKVATQTVVALLLGIAWNAQASTSHAEFVKASHQMEAAADQFHKLAHQIAGHSPVSRTAHALHAQAKQLHQSAHRGEGRRFLLNGFNQVKASYNQTDYEARRSFEFGSNPQGQLAIRTLYDAYWRLELASCELEEADAAWDNYIEGGEESGFVRAAHAFDAVAAKFHRVAHELSGTSAVSKAAHQLAASAKVLHRAAHQKGRQEGLRAPYEKVKEAYIATKDAVEKNQFTRNPRGLESFDALSSSFRELEKREKEIGF